MSIQTFLPMNNLSIHLLVIRLGIWVLYSNGSKLFIYCSNVARLSIIVLKYESLINGKHENRIPCRTDYRFYNYCSTCAIKYSKEIFRCKECNQKVRTRPWHRSKLEEWKRV